MEAFLRQKIRQNREINQVDLFESTMRVGFTFKSRKGKCYSFLDETILSAEENWLYSILLNTLQNTIKKTPNFIGGFVGVEGFEPPTSTLSR